MRMAIFEDILFEMYPKVPSLCDFLKLFKKI